MRCQYQCVYLFIQVVEVFWETFPNISGNQISIINFPEIEKQNLTTERTAYKELFGDSV